MPAEAANRIADRKSYVDLPAIIVGALIASGAVTVFAGFSTSLGMESFSFDDNGEMSAGWFAVTAIFTALWVVGVYWLGGYVTGRMRRPNTDGSTDEVAIRDGIHGLALWGLGMIVSGLMAVGAIGTLGGAVISTAQSTVEGAGSAVGGTLQGVGQIAGGTIQGAGAAAGPTLMEMMPEGLQSDPIGYLSQKLLRFEPRPQTTVQDSSTFPTEGRMNSANRDTDALGQVTAILTNFVTTGDISDDDRDYLRALVASETGLSRNEVDARVDQTIEDAQELRATAQDKLDEARAEADRLQDEAEARLQEATDKAAELAEKARIATVLTAFLLAASALVAAAAAYIGAVHGGNHRDEGRVWGGLSYRRRH